MNIMAFKVSFDTEVLKNNPLLIIAMGLIVMQVVSLVGKDRDEDDEIIIS